MAVAQRAAMRVAARDPTERTTREQRVPGHPAFV